MNIKASITLDGIRYSCRKDEETYWCKINFDRHYMQLWYQRMNKKLNRR